MEQHVGHRTYGENLRAVAAADPDLRATWTAVTYEGTGGLMDRLPALPAGVRGTWHGRRQVRAALDKTDPEAVLFFTQVPAVLGGRRARRAPYVVVLDITPILYDEMAAPYGHHPDRFPPTKWLKHRLNERTLQEAASVLPFSEWAAQSLIDDYGVDPGRIEVIPSGVDVQRWHPDDNEHVGALRILFVGGDFERKGGSTVLRALTHLPPGSWVADVVTRSAVPATPDATVHSDLQPNSEPLRRLFRRADVFVMPSVGEAFGHVVVEAAASGLPAIVSDVGGMPETVVQGETGFVVSPNDDAAVSELLLQLIEQPDLRRWMGAAARQRAIRHYDAARNGGRTIAHLRRAASGR